ncbi:MAG: DUF4198 domain-containing protein [Thermodesulfobacteriota bacterium]
MKKYGQVILITALIFATAPVWAHSLWFNVDDRHTEVGKPVILELGWGHKFPTDSEIKKGMLNQIFALGPDGQKIPLKPLSNTTFQWIPPQPGVHTISATVHPGFLSKTSQGYKMGHKNQFKQALSCFHYDLRGKTFVCAGKNTKVQIQAVGDPLEILPLESPFGLKKGSELAAQVLFKGKPLAEAKVHATYAGFSDQPHTFAQTLHADVNGVARIKLAQKGEWFVSVTHETPYPDKTECDTHKYNATMTFRVE